MKTDVNSDEEDKNKLSSVPVTIDIEFQDEIIRLEKDEMEQLERNLLQDGCTDPLKMWRGLLIDGHHRYALCRKHHIPFETVEIDLPDREAVLDWIDDNQLGRRNLSPQAVSDLRGKKYLRTKKRVGAPAENKNAKKQSGQNVHFVSESKTSNVLADQLGVNEKTIRRDAEFSQALDVVAAVTDSPREVRKQLISKSSPLTKKDITAVAGIAVKDPQKAKRVIEEISAGRADDAKTAIRNARSEAVAEKIEVLKNAPVESLTGKYKTIVIDPPWPMQKIERDSRPDQIGFDYPTMSIDEIRALPVDTLAEDDCHLYLWTTQKYLPDAFDILVGWGFKYIFTMVWHKPGGIQPFNLPQYNCEFIIFGRRGNLPFLDLKQFPTCFNAPRREHSRKPDEFYDIVRRVSPAPRLDMFSRQARPDFNAWGNETEKFNQETSNGL